jgi:hypothetical protein
MLNSRILSNNCYYADQPQRFLRRDMKLFPCILLKVIIPDRLCLLHSNAFKNASHKIINVAYFSYINILEGKDKVIPFHAMYTYI